MPRNLDVREDLGDATVGIDDDGCPLDPHVFAPVKRFLLPDSESVGKPMTFVRKKTVGQLIFLSEFAV
jgi:hypothetical protein